MLQLQSMISKSYSQMTQQVLNITVNPVQVVQNTLNVSGLQLKAAECSNQQKDVAEKGGGAADNVFKKVMSVAGAEIKKFLISSWDAANSRIKAEQRLQSIMEKTRGVTQDGIEMVRQHAIELEQSTSIGADVGIFGMSELAQYVRDPKNIQALSESMYNLAVAAHGVSVSQENMGEIAKTVGQMMQGQTDVFNENGFVLTKQQEKLFEYGSEAEKTALLISMVEQKASGLAQAMAQTPEGKLQQLKNAWGEIKEMVGYGVLREQQKVVDFLLEKMPMIQNVIVGAFNIIASAVGLAIDFIIKNWQYFEPFLITAAIVLIPMIIANLWAMIAPIVAQALAWVGVTLPILLVIGIIGIAIYILRQMGVTAEQVVGTIMGVFAVMSAFIWNIVAAVWNIFASFAEFLINLFIDPVYSIKKLFYDLRMIYLKYLYDMTKGIEDFAGNFMVTINKAINKVLEGLGKLIGLWNKIFGTDFNTELSIDEGNIHAVSDGIKRLMDTIEEPSSSKNIVSIHRMESRDYKASFDSGYQLGAHLVNGLSQIKPPELSKGIPYVDEVGTVGKIRDKVDISNEDLKLMRELAEIQSIQNFVTLTPTVQVQTGDINNGYDIDTIINRIERTLEEEFVSAAEGVYG